MLLSDDNALFPRSHTVSRRSRFRGSTASKGRADFDFSHYVDSEARERTIGQLRLPQFVLRAGLEKLDSGISGVAALK